MLAQLLNKLADWWQFVIAFIVFALIQSYAVMDYLQLPIGIVLTDAFVFAVLYVILTILLQNTLRFGKFNILPTLQELLIHTALVMLSLVILYFSATFLYEFLAAEAALKLTAFLPVRLLFSTLILLLIIQHFRQNECCDELPASETIKPELEIDEPKSLTSSEGISTTEKQQLEHVSVKSGSKIHVIPIQEIVSLQADGDYVHIFTPTGKFLKEQTMKYFEENLPENQFARVHRSYIVNIHAIARIELYDKQSQQITLKNGQQVKVSQAGYKLLRSRLNL